MRYIGSKARIAEAILDRIGPPTGSGVFADALCGSGAVAEEAGRRGWKIHLNDHLLAATTIASARLIAVSQARFATLGGYGDAISHLNDVQPKEGFIWSQYSPASKSRAGLERRYFTEANAARIDGIRADIRAWQAKNMISSGEHRLLIADLLLAASRVANISGTFGCFLSGWSGAALARLSLRPRQLLALPALTGVSNVDVLELAVGEDDTLYLDPPYTKRQYAAYYHLLETIAHGDSPSVLGVTGLRPWQDRASAFCYKRRALNALKEAVQSTAARRVFISYSSDGHVELGRLTDVLASAGGVALHSIAEVRRYRPNAVARRGRDVVEEFLLELRKPSGGKSRAA